MGPIQGDIPHLLPRQGGESGEQRLLYPSLRGAAAVDQLQARGGDQLLIQRVQLFGLHAFSARLTAQAGNPIGLPRTHLPQEAAVCVVPLIVDKAADSVQKVGLFTLKVGRHKAAPLGHWVADQLPQQLCYRLQQLFPAGCKAIVNQARHKAHALILTLFPNRGLNPGTVQLVQTGGKAPHIRAGNGAPPQYGWQQRIGGGSLLPQWRHKLGGKQTRLKLLSRQIRQVYALSQLRSGNFQILSSFVGILYEPYYSIVFRAFQTFFQIRPCQIVTHSARC